MLAVATWIGAIALASPHGKGHRRGWGFRNPPGLKRASSSCWKVLAPRPFLIRIHHQEINIANLLTRWRLADIGLLRSDLNFSA